MQFLFNVKFDLNNLLISGKCKSKFHTKIEALLKRKSNLNINCKFLYMLM